LEVKEFLSKLCEAPRICGYESDCVKFIASAFSEYLDNVKTDTFGNVIGVKKGRGKGTLMLTGRIDEIGMMVTNIDGRGFIRFTAIGGFDARVLPAQEVIIHGREKLYGVIGVKPPHLTPPGEKNNAYKAEDLFIDTGFSREKLVELCGIGDIITLRSNIFELKNGRFSGKSMAGAASAAVLLSAMRYLSQNSHDLDVYYVAATQAKAGICRVINSAYGIEPDIAIAFGASFGKTPELDEIKTIEMGKGPAIAIGPVIHPRVYESLIKSALNINITYQIKVLPISTGTDADNIQISGTGIATGVILTPLKYMHTSVETAEFEDIDQTGRLINEFINAFNDIEMEAALCL